MLRQGGAGPALDRNRHARPLTTGVATVLAMAALVVAVHRLVFAAGLWVGLVLLGSAGAALLVRSLAMPRRQESAEPRMDRDATAWAREAGPRRGLRRHRRLVPTETATVLTTVGGRTLRARIVDVSIGGVAVEARLTDLEFATVIRVGAHPASPLRRTRDGAVFVFTPLLDPVAVNEDLVL